MSNAIATQKPSPAGIIVTFGSKYDMDADKVLGILRNTVLIPVKNDPPATNEEVAAFLVVCNAYELNPFIKEIYGFRSKGKMLTVVSIDGWISLANRHPQMNGVEFEESFNEDESIFAITCKIHRKDRALPTVVTEYFSECNRPKRQDLPDGPWQTHPIRMLRHKTFIQCSRIAFGFAGVMDEDEAERIVPGMILEGRSYEASDEMTAEHTEAIKVMNELGWNAGRQSVAFNGYGGNHEKLMAYLREELAKGRKGAGKKQDAKPAAIQGKVVTEENTGAADPAPNDEESSDQSVQANLTEEKW